MSVTGGRAHRGLLIALALTLPVIVTLPAAESQSPSDPWWGPSDRTRPTLGWAVRVPVIVENKLDYALNDPFVAAEIDLTTLLVKAGWTNQTVGAETRLRGFSLDVDSIRVVEYNRGFVTGPLLGAGTLPTPHTFYPALLEGTKFREFSADRNPAGTVVFQIAGTLAPNEKRYFYVYANPLEYGDTPPPVFDDLEKSPLDAFMWGTRGNVYYGYEPKQEGQNHLLTVGSLAPGPTTVTVSTYELGRYTPIASTSTTPNPFTLQPNAARQVFIPHSKAFKIEASKPIAVAGFGDLRNPELFGYAPGRSGSFADDAFDLYNFGDDIRLIKAGPGRVQVNFVTPFGVQASNTFTLDNANPIVSVGFPDDGWWQLVGNGKFLVSLASSAPTGQNPKPFPPQQVPAITGGPSGKDFFSYLQNDKGYFQICPEANATLRVVDYTAGGSLQIYSPEGTIPNVPAARAAKEEMCREVEVQRSIDASHTFEFYSTKEERDPAPGSPVPFRLFVGTGDRKVNDSSNLTRPMIGHYGGLAGVDYYVDGPTGIFGHYNHTRLTIFEEKLVNGQPTLVNRTRAVQRDEFFPLVPSADGTGRMRIIATKPIAVASIEPAEYQTKTVPTAANVAPQTLNNPIGYGRYVPGRPLMPNATIGAAEFRGPLVDLRSPETDARQLSRSTGPGSPLTLKLDVLNLGRWLARENLPDTVAVTCTTPDGWTVEGCNKEIALSSGSAERLSVVVTPSAEDVNTTRTIQVEARSKAGGVSATFKINVYVEVRYGVGMWFDVEGGRRTIDPPIGLEPGGAYRYNIVVKNTGSTQDTFRFRVDPVEQGWTQDLLLENEPVTSVRLEGGESVILQFYVKAPNLEQAPQNLVSIVAESLSSTLATDVVNTATRIRPKVDLELTLDPLTRLAEPNETVRFNVTTRNKGNDVFTVIFRQDSILPKGWGAHLSVEEITLNPNPSNDPALNYVLQLDVTPPPGARAGDLASLKLAAEVDTGGSGGRVAGDELSAVVVVRRVYELVAPPVFDAEADPGEVFRFVLPITNAGNGQVAIELLPGAVEAVREGEENATGEAWRVALESGDITLDLNATTDLPLRIDVPAGTPPGIYNLTFTTRLSRETIQNLSIPVNVNALSRVEFDGASEFGLTPGRPASVGYVARNTGNVEGTFAFGATLPEGWNATFSPARARLAPGDAVPVLAQINATRDAPDGDHRVTLTASIEGAPPTPTGVDVQVRRPDLAITNVDANGAPRAGELVLVTATVQNRGGIEAENVSVALVVDGVAVDKILLARVPVGASALATLSWVATQRADAVAVVLDPEEEIMMTTRDDSTAAVEFGSRLGVPGPGVLALLSAIGIAFAARAPLPWRQDAKTSRREFSMSWRLGGLAPAQRGQSRKEGERGR